MPGALIRSAATAGESAALLPIARAGCCATCGYPEPFAEIDQWLDRCRALCGAPDGPGQTRTKGYLMTDDLPAGNRILGSLRSADGTGVVRMEDRFDSDIDDVWSALTDPARLARWLGEFKGDLRPGGDYHARYFASGAESTCRVEACEPPRRLSVVSAPGRPDEHRTEVTLTADGEQTVLVVEERGMPLEYLAAYGSGIQIHVEDLGAHLGGGERCDSDARMDELMPAYQELVVVDQP